MSYDIITVGGGLGGSTLALTLARRGLRVLVLERETAFKDRVRGEGILPWGVNEAKLLGIRELLVERAGRRVDHWTSHSWKQRPPRDLPATTPDGSYCINVYHPRLQETMIEAAAEAGAEVRRGVRVTGIVTGSRPAVVVPGNGHDETIHARMVVGSDGRGSRVRQWLGMTPKRDPECLVVAGVLLEAPQVPIDSVHVFRRSNVGQGVLFFPLGDGRVRTYFIYRKLGERRGLSGPAGLPRFIDACVDTDVPPDWVEQATACGPLAEFDGADTWVDHPYSEGIALIGDAASSNDPAWGNGLALTLRDVRALSDALLNGDDWQDAGRAYANAHAEYFGAVRRVTRWLTSLMYEVGPEAEARRDKAFPLMQRDRSRSLDYIALGPDCPSDEAARARFFGES